MLISEWTAVSQNRLPGRLRPQPKAASALQPADCPPARVPFHDPETASSALERITARVSPQLAVALPPLVSESPDPDSSLLLMDRLLAESSEEIGRLLDRHPKLAHYAIVVFGHSRFLGETLIRNTDLLPAFLRERNLDRSLSKEEFQESLARFRSRSLEPDVALLLARFRRREYVRIMLRDVLQISPLAETTAEISALSDVLVDAALREAENDLVQRFGIPQNLDAQGRLMDTPFAILSLGKLGGNELNYGSDVDLMFLYGDGEEPPKDSLSNREFFVRLAQQVTDILSRITPEGPVFRIDLRLRPQGGQGEMAVSLGNALRYYSEAAHDWELQAMIKVRHSAGDLPLAREFIRGVQPRVYTEHINLAAIETVVITREKMQARRHRMEGREVTQAVNVKLDRGGIREIEFLVQCLQRIYGGAEPWLRSGGTLFSLQKLHDKGHLSGRDFHELTNTYEFLRHVEHRLQLRQGQQTHRLPTSQHELQVLQRALSHYEGAEGIKTDDVITTVSCRMNAVAEIYDRIIHHQQTHSNDRAAPADSELHSRILPGFAEHSQHQVLERLAEDAPQLYQIISASNPSPSVRRNLSRFLSSALTSSERYAAVLRHPAALRHALQLFDTSHYLTDMLIRHPEEIATLASLSEPPVAVNAGYLFRELGPQAASRDPAFAYLVQASEPYGERLSLLRQHYRHRIFASGAQDIAQLRDVYASLATTTAAAEDAIDAAYAIAGAPEGLAILALGRLGTSEFDMLSDADLLFVSDESCDRTALIKAAEQIMQVLAAYTRSGTLFPVDSRLRPHGSEGELLASPTQLSAYFDSEAQPWEALTYTKLRFLTGNPDLGRRAATATAVLFRRFASDPSFPETVREMRAKLETPERSFKTSPGGTYDVDFLASYFRVTHQGEARSGNLRDRLWQCAEAGYLGNQDAATLDHAAELLRTVDHITRLVTGRAHKWLPTSEHAAQVAARLTSQILGREFPDGLETELTRTCRLVREIYAKVVV